MSTQSNVQIVVNEFEEDALPTEFSLSGGRCRAYLTLKPSIYLYSANYFTAEEAEAIALHLLSLVQTMKTLQTQANSPKN